MILLLTTWIANAKTDPLVTHLESRSYRQNGKMLVVSTDKVLLSRLTNTDIAHEKLPKIGDTEMEIGRLQNKYGTTCVLNIAPQKDEENGPVSGVTITELGDCSMDESIRYNIQENGKKWTVVDNEGKEVSAHAFANVCEDVPLLLRLGHEENISRRNGKILEWGATGLAVTGLFTMGNPDPGFSAREQNRFWTSVFLFGTAAILYTQRDTPFVYMTDTQSDLANYHTKESAERIILKTFGLPPSEAHQKDERLDSLDASEQSEPSKEGLESTDTETQTPVEEDAQEQATEKDKSDDELNKAPLQAPSEPPQNQPETAADDAPKEGAQ